MQDRTDGFKTHHRIAAAKELIVHIIRDEQPAHTPSPSTGEGRGEGDSPVVPAPTIVVPAKAGTQGGGVARPSKAGIHREPNSPVVPAQAEGNPDNTIVVPAKAGTQGRGVARPSEVGIHPEPNSSVVPAEAGTHPRDPEPSSQLETNNSKLETRPARRPRKRRTRTQRRRDGNARAAIRRKALESERIEEKKDEKPAPAELTIAERRINEKLEQHWHEPDPWAGPIDSATPGRSPP